MKQIFAKISNQLAYSKPDFKKSAQLILSFTFLNIALNITGLWISKLLHASEFRYFNHAFSGFVVPMLVQSLLFAVCLLLAFSFLKNKKYAVYFFTAFQLVVFHLIFFLSFKFHNGYFRFAPDFEKAGMHYLSINWQYFVDMLFQLFSFKSYYIALHHVSVFSSLFYLQCILLNLAYLFGISWASTRLSTFLFGVDTKPATVGTETTDKKPIETEAPITETVIPKYDEPKPIALRFIKAKEFLSAIFPKPDFKYIGQLILIWTIINIGLNIIGLWVSKVLDEQAFTYFDNVFNEFFIPVFIQSAVFAVCLTLGVLLFRQKNRALYFFVAVQFIVFHVIFFMNIKIHHGMHFQSTYNNQGLQYLMINFQYLTDIVDTPLTGKFEYPNFIPDKTWMFYFRWIILNLVYYAVVIALAVEGTKFVFNNKMESRPPRPKRQKNKKVKTKKVKKTNNKASQPVDSSSEQVVSNQMEPVEPVAPDIQG